MQTPQQRDLRTIVQEGVAYSVMVGAGETYVPAFALALGMSGAQAGIVGTFPMLVGSIYQLITPLASRRVGSYRKWATASAFLQALTFLPLIAIAFFGGSFAMVLTIASLYWAFGLAMSPAWNAWVGVLVPAERRAVFFANRGRWCHVALVTSLVGAGLLLQLGYGTGRELHAFAAVFSVACVARLVSAGLLSKHSEPSGLPSTHTVHGPRGAWAALRDAGSIPVLAYLVAMQTAVHIASPFFTPYMLGPLGLSYQQFMSLTAVAFVARVVALPYIGRIATTRGISVVFWFGGIGVAPLPALWLVSSNFYYLLFLQCLSGVVWAALELATTLSFFERIHDRDRASILSVFNVANALAIAAGAAAGGALLDLAPFTPTAYGLIFVASSVARVGTLLLLRLAPKPPRTPIDVSLRTLAVRPSAGAIQRPLLATLPDEPDADSPEA